MIEVLVKNKSGVIYEEDISKIISIIAKGFLADGKIVMVFGGDDTGSLGECMPRSILKYTGRGQFFQEFLDDNWDVGIIIYPKAYYYYKNYPAFFAYLLGHELGHAYVCLTDIQLHLFYCLIQDYICEASNGKVRRWDQLPHEILFDQYGLYIAELIYLREEINNNKCIINYTIDK